MKTKVKKVVKNKYGMVSIISKHGRIMLPTRPHSEVAVHKTLQILHTLFPHKSNYLKGHIINLNQFIGSYMHVHISNATHCNTPDNILVEGD